MPCRGPVGTIAARRVARGAFPVLARLCPTLSDRSDCPARAGRDARTSPAAAKCVPHKSCSAQFTPAQARLATARRLTRARQRQGCCKLVSCGRGGNEL
jgi:hypothetical protein